MSLGRARADPEQSDSLRIHSFLPLSRANGPGRRAVIWTQGCTLACPGCFNPGAFSARGGELVTVENLFRRIVVAAGQPPISNSQSPVTDPQPAAQLEGLTVSGGEPLQQISPLLQLLRRVKGETGLSTVVFTGYNWDEVRAMPMAGELLSCVDVLIAGRFDPALRVAAGLRGSTSKTLHFLTRRYSRADIEAVPTLEMVIAPDGEVVVSGIDPPLITHGC